jgi:23S rRNA G2445 N2-methylase RlmL
MSVPGLGRLLAAEIRERLASTTINIGSDGRSDVALFTVDHAAFSRIGDLRLAEDVFVEVGRTLRSEGDHPRWIVNRIWKRARIERALALWRQQSRRGRGATYRVVTRVQSERAFRRTDLRRELEAAIAHSQRNWKQADPAALEVWITEYARGQFVAGLRLSSAAMRQHKGRAIERRGALRPTVAAAMVRLAGKGGQLLDPCCGSGTILLEATNVGWDVFGMDIDSRSVKIARSNVPTARVEVADVRSLPFDANSFDACVSNLPFGRQFRVDEPIEHWLSKATHELSRVTRVGGRLVLLTPVLPTSILPEALTLRHETHIRLLGIPTVIWGLERDDQSLA